MDVAKEKKKVNKNDDYDRKRNLCRMPEIRIGV